MLENILTEYVSTDKPAPHQKRQAPYRAKARAAVAELVRGKNSRGHGKLQRQLTLIIQSLGEGWRS